MMQKSDKQKSISETYTNVLKEPAGSDGAISQSPITQLARYDDQDLAKLPADAVENSFGCGNPLAYAGVKPGDVVLDLGSGAGIDLLIAAEKVGENGKVIGVDMTDAMIARARNNIDNAGVSNVEIRQGMIENLPVDDNSVDWVISNCVINLSQNKQAVFAEIYRVLKPGGAMQVSDIVMEENSLPDWLANNEKLYNACLAGAISEKQYLQGLADARLEQAQVKERLVYDASTLRGLVLGGEVPEVKNLLDSMPPEEAELLLDSLLQQLAGKVCSAKIFARKPH